MNKYTILFGLGLGLLFFTCKSTSEYSTDSAVIAQGKQLFEMQCTSCHNFKSAGIGPNLAGVTTEVSAEWLKAFIKNPAEMIEAKDERSLQLFKTYKTYMPAFALSPEEDIKAILAYMHTYQEKTQKESTNDYGPPIENPIPDTIPLSDIVVDLQAIATAPPSAEKPPVARINKMVPMPGPQDRLMLHDLNGILYEMKAGKFFPFLKMTDHFPHFIAQPGLATGLGSYAFHPEYATNGVFYTNHTEDPETSAPADFAYADTIPIKVRWVLTEWKQEDPNAKSFSGSKRELLRVDMVGQIHGMQEITFNPLAQVGDADYGKLYIGIGDGAAAQNYYGFLVQNKSQPWGTILRIDPAGRNSKNGKYGIPNDNPYAAETSAGSLGEIWAMGFRNPHRMIWDKRNGNMLASDIGHRQIEEVNIIEPGRNYGWPEREGTFRLDKMGDLDLVYALPENDTSYPYTYPVMQFDHDEAGAISHGFVYTGQALPLLQGKYLFGGIVNGRIFCATAADFQFGQQAPMQELSLRLNGGPITSLRELTGIKRTDLRFGIDSQDELYIFTKADGKIYRVVGADRDAL